MIEIDWSKAPEGATHCHEWIGGTWLKEDGGGIYYRSGDEWEMYGSSDYASKDAGIDALRGATPKPIEWNGEGLPPVGIECEINCGGVWEVGSVLFVGKSVVVVQYGVVERCINPINNNFRPIRSEEDIAVEAMMQVDPGKGDWEQYCRNLYKEGYRKPSKPIEGVL